MKIIHRIRKHISLTQNDYFLFDYSVFEILPEETIAQMLYVCNVLPQVYDNWIDMLCEFITLRNSRSNQALRFLAANTLIIPLLLQNKRFQNLFFDMSSTIGIHVRTATLLSSKEFLFGCKRYLLGSYVESPLCHRYCNYFNMELCEVFFQPTHTTNPFQKMIMQTQMLDVIILIFLSRRYIRDHFHSTDYWRNVEIHLWKKESIISILMHDCLRTEFKPDDLLTNQHIVEISLLFPDWISIPHEIERLDPCGNILTINVFSNPALLPFLKPRMITSLVTILNDVNATYPQLHILFGIFVNPHDELMDFWESHVDILAQVFLLAIQFSGYLHRGFDYVLGDLIEIGFQTMNPRMLKLLETSLSYQFFEAKRIQTICLLYRHETTTPFARILQYWIPLLLEDLQDEANTRQLQYWFDQMATSPYAADWFVNHPKWLEKCLPSFCQNPAPQANLYLRQNMENQKVELATLIDCDSRLKFNLYCEMDCKAMRKQCFPLAKELLSICH